MEGCIAPSEIPGVSASESRIFGKLAEDLISTDIRSKHSYSASEVYVDDDNPGSYLYFLKSHNPALQLFTFASALAGANLGMKRPDVLIHSFVEKVYYEIKPNSVKGRQKGIEKVGILSATYNHFNLKYTPGLSYKQSEIVVASIEGQLTVKLKAELKGPGLILYQLCLNCNAVVDLVTLAAILRYVTKKLNEQAGSRSFNPVNLSPAFAREGELTALARALGLVMASGAAVVGWKYFWKAVAIRFSARGAMAALLASADGPLPVGDLMAAGVVLWMVVDIVRLSGELWTDAAKLQGNEA